MSLIASTAVLAEGGGQGGSRWPLVLASACSIQCTNSKHIYPAVTTPPAGVWPAIMLQYDDIAVLASRSLRAWYYWQLACALHSLGRATPTSSHIPGYFQHLVKLQEPSDNFNLAINVSWTWQIIYGTGNIWDRHCWWFHQRMSGASKEHQPLALYHLTMLCTFKKVSAW